MLQTRTRIGIHRGWSLYRSAIGGEARRLPAVTPVAYLAYPRNRYISHLRSQPHRQNPAFSAIVPAIRNRGFHFTTPDKASSLDTEASAETPAPTNATSSSDTATDPDSASASPPGACDEEVSLEAAVEQYRLGLVQSALNDIATDQKKLDSTPADHPKRPLLLNNLATAIGRHHIWAEIKGEGELPKAIGLVEEAVVSAGEDHPQRRILFETLAGLYYKLYRSTGKGEVIQQGIDWAKRAIDAIQQTVVEEEALKDATTAVKQLLIMCYRARYEDPVLGWDLQDLDSALALQEKIMEESRSEGKIPMQMFDTYCFLMAQKATATDNIRLLDKAIEGRSQYAVDPEDKSGGGAHNWSVLCYLLARKLTWTREPHDLEELLRVAVKGLPQPSDPSIPIHRAKALLNVANIAADYKVRVCLMDVAIEAIKTDTEEHIRLRQEILGQLASTLDQLWQKTKSANVGRLADTVDVHSARTNTLVASLDEGKSLEEVLAGELVTMTVSRQTGKMITYDKDLNVISEEDPPEGWERKELSRPEENEK